jgi:alkanesulfonate monooxygenase SsuD/methylene tetrahydromethanopterin reductase-like flavin-dependent oxidoreductase (luciferase family)
MRLGAFLLPSAAAPPEEFRKGYAGANPNYYQRALFENAEVIRQVEDLGFDFVAFSEHHFHLEGLEISNNPILLGAWAAGMTERLRIGQMATVLPARNPILVAEDLAMLDHFSGGRMFAGFARGYQTRHVTTVGQKNQAVATYPTDPDYAEHDARNRELFDEHYRIVRGLWENREFSFQGKHWAVPPSGISWEHPGTRQMAPGIVDEHGVLQKIGIAPNTLQDPATIEVAIPFTLSPNTIRWSAGEGAWPIIFTPIEETVKACLDAYHEAALERDPSIGWGQNVGHFRDIVVADTDEEAFAIGSEALGFIWPTWHDWFGFNEALRYPGEEGPIGNDYKTMVERGYSLAGSVDTVARRLEHAIETFNMELIVLWMGIGPAPIDKMLRSNELLVDKVLPKLGITLDQITPTLRPEFDTPKWTEEARVAL